ncbi:putative Zn-dependent peptidase [Angulomicrobium tetraedrale]|uniref:Putative Zn-dependent peptidase n=1 Tax=Ancylobacter tetraedralis TaxID=217068 RepID=A0A839YYV7_9HYPH|nr:pitrilysin family protein [Ancylobacter tetraedralis]MBB3769704.1 putative Zn-dependent peptidase [Ancylobacter tetraedralis]
MSTEQVGTARITTLDNGVTVITDAMPHLATASLGIWAGVGARDEEGDEHGISHLLEHMAFKGTRRRSARAIAEEIEAVGGDINAATSVEHTSYNARVLGEDMPLALDVLSDILTEPAFDPEELEREHNVIVQEIGAALDTPDDLVFDLFQERAFPGQPIGRSILGTPETVRSFDAGRLRTYLARNYRAPKLILSAAGAVDHDAVVAEAHKRLGGFVAQDKPVPVTGRYQGGVEIGGGRDLEQAHLLIGLEGLSYRDPEIHALQVFTNILGGGMSSRLFQEVREARGLCYAVYSFHWGYADTGLFGIYAGTDGGDVGELVDVVIDQVEATVEGLTEAELARSKAQAKVGLLAALESSGARADQLARQMLAFGRPIPLEEIVAKLEAVTLERARAAGRAMIARGRPTFTALGPGKPLASAARIAERLKAA